MGNFTAGNAAYSYKKHKYILVPGYRLSSNFTCVALSCAWQIIGHRLAD